MIAMHRTVSSSSQTDDDNDEHCETKYRECIDAVREHALALAKAFVADFYCHTAKLGNDHELSLKIGVDFLDLAKRDLQKRRIS
ncbi:hypothetical protein ACVWXO_001804 [Bradyrhizobium sp. LM2.7]